MEAECKERFDKIDKRLDEGDDVIGNHSIEIEVLKTNMANLSKDLSSLTKALWGVTASIFTALLGFFIWYIQNLGR